MFMWSSAERALHRRASFFFLFADLHFLTEPTESLWPFFLCSSYSSLSVYPDESPFFFSIRQGFNKKNKTKKQNSIKCNQRFEPSPKFSHKITGSCGASFHPLLSTHHVHRNMISAKVSSSSVVSHVAYLDKIKQKWMLKGETGNKVSGVWQKKVVCVLCSGRLTLCGPNIHPWKCLQTRNAKYRFIC